MKKVHHEIHVVHRSGKRELLNEWNPRAVLPFFETLKTVEHFAEMDLVEVTITTKVVKSWARAEGE